MGRGVLAVMPEWWGAMGSSRWSTDHSPTAHLLLCSLVSNCAVHSPKGWGPLLYIAWVPTKYIWLVKYHTLSRYFLDGWMDGQKNEQRNKGINSVHFFCMLKIIHWALIFYLQRMLSKAALSYCTQTWPNPVETSTAYIQNLGNSNLHSLSITQWQLDN